MTSGGCLCGAVRFRVAGALTNVVTCHCKMCRQWHGAPGPYANTSAGGLHFEADDGLSWYRSSDFASRGFCRRCGSSLFWKRDKSDEISIAAGTLDDPTGLTSVRHIFVAHKGDWYEIPEGLPQEAEGSD